MHEKYSSHHNTIHQQEQNYFITFQHLLTFPIILFDDFYFIFNKMWFLGRNLGYGHINQQGASPRES